MDAAYTIRFDWALEADRLAAAAGVETHYLQDFQAEFDWIELPVHETPDNVTDLRDWVAMVNLRMGGQG